MFIMILVLVYFRVILLWSRYESLILIPSFVLLVLQIDRGDYSKSLHQKGTTIPSVIRFLWSESVSGVLMNFVTIREQCIATTECLRME